MLIGKNETQAKRLSPARDKGNHPDGTPDALDVALEQLAQSVADLGVVVNVMRQFRHNAAGLQPVLADEIRGL